MLSNLCSHLDEYRRAAQTPALIFALFSAWDYVATVGVRVTAAESLWAVPLAAIYTAFWFYGVRVVANKRAYAAVVILAAVLGTWAGITFP